MPLHLGNPYSTSHPGCPAWHTSSSCSVVPPPSGSARHHLQTWTLDHGTLGPKPWGPRDPGGGAPFPYRFQPAESHGQKKVRKNCSSAWARKIAEETCSWVFFGGHDFRMAMQQPNWWNPQKYLVQDSSVQSCCRLVATNKDNAGCNVVWVDGRNPLGEHRTSRWK